MAPRVHTTPVPPVEETVEVEATPEEAAPKRRIDPIARLEAELAAVKEREAVKAQNRLEGLRGAVTRAENQLARWARIKDEAIANLRDAEAKAGVVPANEAESYGEAIRSDRTDDTAIELTIPEED